MSEGWSNLISDTLWVGYLGVCSTPEDMTFFWCMGQRVEAHPLKPVTPRYVYMKKHWCSVWPNVHKSETFFSASGIEKVEETKILTWLGIKTILNQYLTTTTTEKNRRA